MNIKLTSTIHRYLTGDNMRSLSPIYLRSIENIDIRHIGLIMNTYSMCRNGSQTVDQSINSIYTALCDKRKIKFIV